MSVLGSILNADAATIKITKIKKKKTHNLLSVKLTF